MGWPCVHEGLQGPTRASLLLQKYKNMSHSAIVTFLTTYGGYHCQFCLGLSYICFRGYGSDTLIHILHIIYYTQEMTMKVVLPFSHISHIYLISVSYSLPWQCVYLSSTSKDNKFSWAFAMFLFSPCTLLANFLYCSWVLLKHFFLCSPTSRILNSLWKSFVHLFCILL